MTRVDCADRVSGHAQDEQSMKACSGKFHGRAARVSIQRLSNWWDTRPAEKAAEMKKGSLSVEPRRPVQ